MACEAHKKNEVGTFSVPTSWLMWALRDSTRSVEFSFYFTDCVRRAAPGACSASYIVLSPVQPASRFALPPEGARAGGSICHKKITATLWDCGFVLLVGVEGFEPPTLCL